MRTQVNQAACTVAAKPSGRVSAEKTGRRQKPFIRPQQFSALLELIVEPYSTMVFVAVYTGLRVSELIGLRWNDINEDSIFTHCEFSNPSISYSPVPPIIPIEGAIRSTAPT